MPSNLCSVVVDGFRASQGRDSPVRFKTEKEVIDYGGTTYRESGKVTFSRSMEIRCLITGSYLLENA